MKEPKRARHGRDVWSSGTSGTSGTSSGGVSGAGGVASTTSGGGSPSGGWAGTSDPTGGSPTGGMLCRRIPRQPHSSLRSASRRLADELRAGDSRLLERRELVRRLRRTGGLRAQRVLRRRGGRDESVTLSDHAGAEYGILLLFRAERSPIALSARRAPIAPCPETCASRFRAAPSDSWGAGEASANLRRRLVGMTRRNPTPAMVLGSRVR